MVLKSLRYSATTSSLDLFAFLTTYIDGKELETHLSMSTTLYTQPVLLTWWSCVASVAIVKVPLLLHTVFCIFMLVLKDDTFRTCLKVMDTGKEV